MDDIQSGDYISDEERQRLISKLHRLLVWVGEPLPDQMIIDGETIRVHEVVWSCIHKKEFTIQEKVRFEELISLLEKKEKYYEEILQRKNVTREDAKKLYHEIACILRAIMDIRECREGKVKLKESRDQLEYETKDAKRWISFLKNVRKKNSL